MKKLKPFILLLITFIISCDRGNSEHEKFHKQRNNVINVKDKIVDIETKIYIGYTDFLIIGDFLILNETFAKKGKSIHLFDKNTFEYLASTGIIGRGPGEIANKGRIEKDFNKESFWACDHGKLVMWEFPIDSILNDDDFIPTQKREMNKDLFFSEFEFFNDTMALGQAIRPLSVNTYERITAKYDLNKNTINEYGYAHSEVKGIKKSLSYFSLSVNNGIYVNAYGYFDLMTICDFDGNLKYNIYGPDWAKNNDFTNYYYSRGISITNDKIITGFLGDKANLLVKKNYVSNFPSKFLVFDLHGNYKQTIETGHKFLHFCVDEENERIICYFEDRDNPLGYFNMK